MLPIRDEEGVLHTLTASERASRATATRNDGRIRGGTGHPATSDIDYQPEDIEFMHAISRFQYATGKKYPTWREVLGVVKSLGYTKTPEE